MPGTTTTFHAPDGLHACVHCGLCLSACPTYVELGSEADSPRGRIQLLQGLESGRLQATDEVRRHLDLCLGCRACEPACPSGVPYGALIEAARPYVEARRPPLPRLLRRALVRALASRGATAPLRLVRLVPGLDRLARLVPGMGVAYLAALRDTRKGAPLPLVLDPSGSPRGTAALLLGCVSDELFDSTNRAAALLLQKAGARVIVVPDRCCGALFAHAGQADAAQERSGALARALPCDVDWVVTTAAGCGAHLRGLHHVLPGDPRAAEVARHARDALSLLAELGLPAPAGRVDERVAVHDPCHLVHGQGVRGEVRALLRSVPGVHLVDLEESDVCCGSAGTYNLTEPAMARRLLLRKLRCIEASGATVIAAANPGCLLQIRAGVLKRGLGARIEHPLDLLARAHGLS
jgi:glycolate oxidase iron-sulfur subunit